MTLSADRAIRVSNIYYDVHFSSEQKLQRDEWLQAATYGVYLTGHQYDSVVSNADRNNNTPKMVHERWVDEAEKSWPAWGILRGMHCSDIW